MSDVMAFRFQLKQWCKGIVYVYKEIWEVAIDGVELPCKREIGNAHNPFAVAIKKATSTVNVTVCHTREVISLVCLVFIRWGENILCIVDGTRQC